MEAIRLQKAVEKDGEIFLSGLPYKKGQYIEMILMIDSSAAAVRPRLTSSTASIRAHRNLERSQRY